MKILLAPDKFKGSLAASGVAECMKKGISKVSTGFDIVTCPLSDGGDGFVDIMHIAGNGKIIEQSVFGPLNKPIKSHFTIIDNGKTAVIEVALASGLALIGRSERNPLKTTSYGTGQLIKRALDCGCGKIVIGLGGSATNDAGMGIAAALGVKFLNIYGDEITSYDGESLAAVVAINTKEIDTRIYNVEVLAACDVENPLYGKNGAAHVFAAQKGATELQIKQLDKNLRIFADVLNVFCGKKNCSTPGTGAAGGIGVMIISLLRGKLCSGFELVSEALRLKEKIVECDIIFTGEGKIDAQTMQGKVVYSLCKLAKQYNVPVIAVCGMMGNSAEKLYEHGMTSMFSIIDSPMKVEEALSNAHKLLISAVERITRLFSIGANESSTNLS